MLERYTQVSGRTLAPMSFYLGLAFFKAAVVFEAIHYRYIQGFTEGDGVESVGLRVPPLVSAGLAALKETRELRH